MLYSPLMAVGPGRLGRRSRVAARRARRLVQGCCREVFPQRTILGRYVLVHFLTVLGVCLLASVSLFLVFEFFDRLGIFLNEKTSIDLILLYLSLRVPLVVHLMMPVAVLIATLISVGRLSQQSEVIAMRASGMSVWAIARPLVKTGVCISALMLVLGETIVPWATDRVEELYHFEIRKKAEKGQLSRSNFWYRSGNQFFNFGLYDAKTSTLRGVSIYELDPQFRLSRRLDAREAQWAKTADVGWTMKEVIETVMDSKRGFRSSAYAQLPLVIPEKPEDFYNIERRSETLGYFALRRYIDKLQREGVSVTNYMVDLAAKLSFPLVNTLAILLAFPFTIVNPRSGSPTLGFICGTVLGFAYYVVHAISTSLGKAELLPIVASAWAANIIFACVGGYLMAGAEISD